MNKKIFYILLIAGISLLNAKNISLRDFLSDYNKVHKNIEFFVLKENNIKNFTNKMQEKKLLNYNIQTLKYFLETKFNAGVDFKSVNMDGKKILFLEINKNKKPDKPFDFIIKELSFLKKYGEKLSVVNPDFNYNEYKKDLNVIVQKLKEYKNLSN